MPWHRSSGNSTPLNAMSGRPSRGINTLLLWAAAAEAGYSTGEWATYVRKDLREMSVAAFDDYFIDDLFDLAWRRAVEHAPARSRGGRARAGRASRHRRRRRRRAIRRAGRRAPGRSTRSTPKRQNHPGD